MIEWQNLNESKYFKELKMSRQQMPAVKKVIINVTLSLLILGLIGCSSPEEKANKYLQKGNALLEKGNPVKASIEFQNALQINKTLVPAIYGLALVAESKGNWQEMYGLLSKVVEQDPKHIAAQLKLGSLLLAADKLDEAFAISNKLLVLNKDDSAILAFRAAVLLKMGDTKGALEQANLALAKKPDNIEALVVLASERIAAGDSAKAVEYLDKGITHNQKNIALQLIKVAALENLSDLTKAEQVHRKLIEYYPETPAFRMALAQFYLKHKMPDKAEAELRAIAAKSPADVQAKMDIISFLSANKGPQAARQEMENYVKAEPANNELKFVLFGLYQSQNDPVAAEKVLNEVITGAKSQEDVAKAKGMLAGKYLSEGKKDKAIKLADEVLAVDSRNEQALLLKAGIDIDDRKLDQAVERLRTILRDSPNSSRALLLLATAHNLSGAYELADEHYLRAFQAGKMTPQYGMPYVEFLLKRNQPQRAEKILLDVLANSPKSVPALKLLAQAKIARGDWVGAQQVADQIKHIGNTDQIADQIMGVILAGQKNYGESIAAFKRAYDNSPTETQPIAAMVRTYVLAGKQKEAMSFLTSVLAANPANVDARVMQGQLFAASGEKQQAIDAFKAVINQAPKSVLGYQQLAALYMREKQNEDAQQTILQGLAVVPADFGLRLTQAGIYEATGKFDDAIKTYEALIKERPESDVIINNLVSLITDHRTDKPSLERAYTLAQRLGRSEVPYFKDTVGWAGYKTGKWNEAISNLESATKALPDVAVFQYHLGMAYLANADKPRARKALEKALKLAAGGQQAVPVDEINNTLKGL